MEHVWNMYGKCMDFLTIRVFFRCSFQIFRDFLWMVAMFPAPVVTLWLFNIAMEAMAHRNRCFTY